MPDFLNPVDAFRWAMSQFGVNTADPAPLAAESPPTPSEPAPTPPEPAPLAAESPPTPSEPAPTPSESAPTPPSPASPLGRPPAAGVLAGGGLTLDRVRGMTPAQINDNWEAVQKVLAPQEGNL